MPSLPQLLDASAALHHHLCPRQVVGVRMGLFAGDILGLDLPQTGKRLLVIVETDGCAADGIAVAAGCWVGRRTLRVEHYGKVAATFVDTHTKQTVRIVPRPGVRDLACQYAPEVRNKWEAQLLGYQHIPGDLLFTMQVVALKTPIEQIVGWPGLKAFCEACGEEIINGREVRRKGLTLCRACAGARYYLLASDPLGLPARQTAPLVSHP